MSDFLKSFRHCGNLNTVNFHLLGHAIKTERPYKKTLSQFSEHFLQVHVHLFENVFICLL